MVWEIVYASLRVGVFGLTDARAPQIHLFGCYDTVQTLHPPYEPYRTVNSAPAAIVRLSRANTKAPSDPPFASSNVLSPVVH